MQSLTDEPASTRRAPARLQQGAWYAACAATGVLAPHPLAYSLFSDSPTLWLVPVVYGGPALAAALATPRCDELDRVWGALLTLGSTLAVIAGWVWLLAGLD